MKQNIKSSDIIHLAAGEGRKYDCGSMTAIFKSDETETESTYSISEWWLEPNSSGPGPHKHDLNDEIFYGIEGTVSILLEDNWIDLHKGDFIRIPKQVLHDFTNKTNQKCGLLNFYIPGGFERKMPSIVKWFEENTTN